MVECWSGVGWGHEIQRTVILRVPLLNAAKISKPNIRRQDSALVPPASQYAEPDYPLACLQRWNGIRQYALDPREWQLDVHGTTWLVGDRVEHAAGAGAICEAY